MGGGVKFCRGEKLAQEIIQGIKTTRDRKIYQFLTEKDGKAKEWFKPEALTVAKVEKTEQSAITEQYTIITENGR